MTTPPGALPPGRESYAGQVTDDYDALGARVRAGRVPAVQEG
jgi:hypothetical protein